MMTAAKGTGITVLPGMEVQTREEVSSLCLFDTLEQVVDWSRWSMPTFRLCKNKEQVFGTQVVLDVDGNVGTNDRLLATSVPYRWIKSCSGLGIECLCIPSHVDRPAYSLIANLGLSRLTGNRGSRNLAPRWPEGSTRPLPAMEHYSRGPTATRTV